MRPNDRSYMKSHEWCKIDGEIATIGITDFAVSHLFLQPCVSYFYMSHTS